jgi:hypothetical protein
MAQSSTFFQQLSGKFLENISKSSPIFAEMLSAAARMQELSGVPSTPYEKMKYDLFGKDYTFKTIDDIPDPENFNLDALTESIKQISKQLAQTTLSAASGFQIQQENINPENVQSLTFEMPEYLIDKNLARKNIEFSEIVRSLTVERLKEQPVEIAKKLVAHFAEMYK